MQKGIKIKAPAIVRRRYKGEWEYALNETDDTTTPFGAQPPRQVVWVYQVTWKDELQRIHRVKPEEKEIPSWSRTPENECWWVTRPGPPGSYTALDQALAIHSKEPPQ